MKSNFFIFFLIISFTLFSISMDSNMGGNLKFSTNFSVPSYIPVPVESGIDISGSNFYVKVHNKGDPAEFRITYQVYPRTNNITVIATPNHFYLDTNSEKVSFLSIYVEKHTYGKYNLTIIVEGKVDNIVLASSKKILIECVKGKVYHVKVYTRLYDGTPIFSRILVSMEWLGEKITILEGYGPEADFYLLNRTYVFSAYIGNSKLTEKTVNVNKDGIEVYLEFTLIKIHSLEIKRPPRYTTDPLIFSVKVSSISDLVTHKRLDIYMILSNNEGNQSVKIGEVELNGKQTVTITGFIDPPKEWRNETYVMEIVALSNDKILAKLTTQLNIVVYGRVVQIQKESPIMYYAISALTGFIGAVMGVYIGRRRAFVETEIRKPDIRKVIILGEGRVLFIYDVVGRRIRRDLIENDRYTMALSMAESLLTVSKRMEVGVLRAYTTEKSKFILKELENGFDLILEVDPETDERDPSLENLVQRLVNFVNQKHKEAGIDMPSKIINLSKYEKLFEKLYKLL